MELSENLKEKVAEAKSKEEAKEILEKAGMCLTEEELDMVAGGRFDISGPPPKQTTIA